VFFVVYTRSLCLQHPRSCSTMFYVKLQTHCVCACVCVCALASLLGPTCVPEPTLQGPVALLGPKLRPNRVFFIDFDNLTLSMPTYHYKPHRSIYYPYWVLTHPPISIGSSLRVYCVCNTLA